MACEVLVTRDAMSQPLNQEGVKGALLVRVVGQER